MTNLLGYQNNICNYFDWMNIFFCNHAIFYRNFRTSGQPALVAVLLSHNCTGCFQSKWTLLPWRLACSDRRPQDVVKPCHQCHETNVDVAAWLASTRSASSAVHWPTAASRLVLSPRHFVVPPTQTLCRTCRPTCISQPKHAT